MSADAPALENGAAALDGGPETTSIYHQSTGLHPLLQVADVALDVLRGATLGLAAFVVFMLVLALAALQLPVVLP